MAVPPRKTRVNHDGLADAHDAFKVRYGACTIKPVAPWAPTIVYGLTEIMVITFRDNVLFIWR